MSYMYINGMYKYLPITYQLSQANQLNNHALAGNHDAMQVTFIDDQGRKKCVG